MIEITSRDLEIGRAIYLEQHDYDECIEWAEVLALAAATGREEGFAAGFRACAKTFANAALGKVVPPCAPEHATGDKG